MLFFDGFQLEDGLGKLRFHPVKAPEERHGLMVGF
jgi:hypothetical protein